MSVAAAKHFLDRIYTDQDLMSELKELKDAPQDEQAATSVARGAELGFDFTAQEFSEVEQIKRFWQKVGEDDVLRAKMQEIGTGKEPQEVVDGVVELAAGEGFSFSAGSMVSLSNLQVAEDASRELSAEDLEQVAGGSLSTSSFGTTLSVVRLVSSDGFASQQSIMCPW